MKRTRKVLAAIACLAAGAAVLVAGPPASAASVGTVTVSYAAFIYSVTPGTVTGDVSDTFILANTLTSGNSDANYYISLKDDTGQVSLGFNTCAVATDCKVLDVFAGTATGTFTINAFGTVDVMRVYSGGAPTKIGTITISSGASSPPAPSEFTARADANGGACTGPTSWTRIPGNAAFPGVFALPTASACTRAGHTLLGWSPGHDADEHTLLAPGSQFSMSDADVTLYAVWSTNGLVITYDANVAMVDQCVANGANVATRGGRRTTVTVTPSTTTVQAARLDPQNYARWSAGLPSAPCAPPGYVLTGWSTSPTGSPTNIAQADAIITTGDGLSSNGLVAPGRNQLTLYAKWTVGTYAVSFDPAQSAMASGESSNLTVTVTVDGSPIRGAVVALAIPGTVPLNFSNGTKSATVIADERGRATAAVVLGGSLSGSASVKATIGTATATATITEKARSKDKSITITGSRTTVSGKPGVRVEGTATGLSKGTAVVPWIKFPGQTEYAQASARPTVDARGDFSWERKTGKKVYVYFTTEDGTTSSNRIIIPAN